VSGFEINNDPSVVEIEVQIEAKVTARPSTCHVISGTTNQRKTNTTSVGGGGGWLLNIFLFIM
jgi:hypothetical protein